MHNRSGRFFLARVVEEHVHVPYFENYWQSPLSQWNSIANYLLSSFSLYYSKLAVSKNVLPENV